MSYRGVRMLKKLSFLPFLATISILATTQAADIMAEIQSLNGQRTLFNDTQVKLNLLVDSLDNSVAADQKSRKAIVTVLQDTTSAADVYSQNCEKIKERIQVKAQVLVDKRMHIESENIKKDLASLKTIEESNSPEEYQTVKNAIEAKNRMQTCVTLTSVLSGFLQSQAGQSE